MTKATTMTSDELMAKAKAYRASKGTSTENLEIARSIPTKYVKAFDQLVKDLEPKELPQGISPYENKDGKVTGILLNESYTGRRGLYLSHSTIENFEAISLAVLAYKTK
jgi:hypothetical protein